jgi:hypothetical protein
MIDWNNNGKIDPEEVFLTEVILSEDEEEPPVSSEEPQLSKHSGCIFSLLTLPFLFILRGLHL